MTGDGVSRETKQATVKRESPRVFLAWCPPCADGRRTHRRAEADAWAFKHNLDRHKESNE